MGIIFQDEPLEKRAVQVVSFTLFDGQEVVVDLGT